MFPIDRIRVEMVEECASTNTEIIGRASGHHGILLVARKQTQGAGRRGRTWFTPEGNLACTLALDLQQQSHSFLLPWIPFWMGVALFEAVKEFLPKDEQAKLTLKWPNDLYWGGKKMAGMLTQVRHQGEQIRAAAGVGLNLQTVPEEKLSHPAVSLQEAMKSVAPSLETFVAKFTEQLLKNNPEDLLALKQSWQERSQMIGRKIRFGNLDNPKSMQEAHVVGLTNDGSLRVLTKGREAHISSDDVSLR